MDWKILQSLIGYTFYDLDIQGNQMFSLQYSPASESEIEQFKRIFETDLNAKSQMYPISTASIKLIAQEAEAERAPIESIPSPCSLNSIQFSISKQVPSLGSARK